MNRTIAIMVASVALVATLLMMLIHGDPDRQRSAVASGEAQPLVLFCAASNRAVMEAIRADYEEEFGIPIQIQYGGSQTLLSSMDVSKSGDLYLPADDSFIDLARDKDLIDEVIPVARMQGVIAIKKGNPKSIKSFADLMRDDVRLVQASADATAIGRKTRKLLTEAGTWEELSEATTASRTTVTDVANDIVVGAADAGIVYDAVLHTYPDLEFIEVPELAAARSQIAISIIKGTKQPPVALHFARYVTARDRGLLQYKDHGFRVEGGDKWDDVPELTFFAGSMLRPAIDDTIAAFEKREGVRISRIYNGCGILVAQMQAGQRPDAYFACDKEFMEQVPDLFPEPVDVSQNELVILVKKGNPLGITGLRDLANKGVSVGIGHEKQCAMGWLTQNTLRETGVQEEVMENVTLESATGDLLVNQMLTGSLDAAVVYLSNAAGAGETLDALRIDGLECSIATQPFAIAAESPYATTASRLFEQICSADSQEIFAAEGFRWHMDQGDTSER